MSTILDLRRFLTHSDPSPAPVQKREEDTEDGGGTVKIEDEEGRVEDVEIEEGEKEEPEEKKLKLEETTEEDVKPDLAVIGKQAVGVVEEEKDEFDALLDDDDGIDFAAIEGI